MDAAQLMLGAAIVLAVVAFVAWPMFAGGRRRTPAEGGAAVDGAHIERRIVEYREALRRRTVCDRCLHANVAEARFCAECGSRLPAADREAA